LGGNGQPGGRVKISTVVKAMFDAGASSEMVLAVVAALEVEMEQTDPLERSRAAARDRVRRYRERRNLADNDWVQLTAQVYERDGYVCTYCGDVDGPHQVDHVMPLAKGGTNDIDNLAVACKVCNASKRDLTLDEWKGFQ
jgi:hypothetical protein